jgi:hypothetical protein
MEERRGSGRSWHGGKEEQKLITGIKRQSPKAPTGIPYMFQTDISIQSRKDPFNEQTTPKI